MALGESIPPLQNVNRKILSLNLGVLEIIRLAFPISQIIFIVRGIYPSGA